MSGGLTAEQLKRIEDNRKKALAKRAEKSKNQSVLNHDQTSYIIQNGNNRDNEKSSSVKVNIVSTEGSKNKTVTDEIVSQVDGRQPCRIVQSEKTNIPVSCIPKDPTHFSHISSQDRIEQNRLKALAKRAEKSLNCPQKNDSPSIPPQRPSTKTAGCSLIANINKESISALSAQSKWSASIATDRPGSSNISSSLTKPMSCDQSSKNFSLNTTSSFKAQSTVSDKPQSGGWNAFESVGKGTVKGKCVLFSRDRFCVEIGYSSPLIQFFKSLETKLYGKFTGNCFLTHYQTTNFGLFQTERVCRRQFQNGRKLSKQVENTVGKGEIARYKQFLFFPHCFQKACFPGVSKGVIVWEWVKPQRNK